MSAPQAAGGPPPWIDPSMQTHLQWRDDDILIAVPPKSGTTWSMNIVHQLLTGGDGDFVDIYAEVPWIEFVTRPGMPRAELEARIAAMPTTRPRAFKTHGAPPELPYIAPGAGPRLRYLVVMRNPEEALVSMRPFLEAHSDELLAAWQVPRAAVTFPDFQTFYAGMGRHALAPRLFGFLAAWWPLRHAPNVLCLHYNDMKRDHAGALRRIAAFLGVTPSAEAWPRILEYTSFAWMKQHSERFDGLSAEIPPIKPGGMVRQGEAGRAHEEGITAALAADLRAAARAWCDDEAAIDWMYAGGALP